MAANAEPSAAAGWRPAAECDELVEQFDRDGYCIIKGALDAGHVERLRATLDEMRPVLEASPMRKKVDILDKGRQVPGLDVRCMVTQRRAVGPGASAGSGDGDGSAASEFPFLHLLDHPRTFPVALRALGNPNISLLTSHLICAPPVPPGTGSNIGWHTDGGSPQFSVDGVRAFQQLKIGYFLVDLPEDDMGSLVVVPGSHKRPAIGHLSADDGADPPGAVQLKVEKGDAVLFQQGLWHAGGKNRSDQVRVVMYFGYGARYLRPMDFVPETLPKAFVERLSPVQRQLMGLSGSPLGYYIPQPGDVPLRPMYERHFGVEHHRK